MTATRASGTGEHSESSPRFQPKRLRAVRRRDMLVRFAAGALTSVAAGVVTLVWGPRVGGVFLAFPAILAASLTLIEEEEAAKDAREDSRGAVAGGLALTTFAAVAYVGFGHVAGAVTLALAGVAWLVVALALYLVIRRRG